MRLRALQTQFPETLWAARAAFVLGKLALEDQKEEAADLLSQAMTLTDVQDYVLFYQAQAYRQKQLFPQAVGFYDRLLAEYPDSAIMPSVFYQRALTLMESGNCALALKGVEDYTSRYPKDAHVPEALLGIARCFLKLEDPIQAVKALRRIWIQYPVHVVAEEAEAILSRVQSMEITIPEPTPEERYQRAQALYASAYYNEALVEFLTLRRDSPTRYRAEATIKLAMTQIQLKRYGEARQVLEGYIAQLPTHNSQLTTQNAKEALQALHWLARIAVRLGEEELLIEAEKKLAAWFSKDTRRARVLIYMGSFYEDRNRPAKALKAYQQVLTEFKNDPMRDEAVWRIGWMAYRAGRYEETIQTFSSDSASRAGGDHHGRFHYWTGRSAENLGRLSQAVGVYEDLCRALQRTYYCQMAEERLERLRPDPPEVDQGAHSAIAGAPLPLPAISTPSSHNSELSTRNSELGTQNSKLSLDPRYRTAKELMTLGLDEEASGELDLLTKRYASDRAALLELSGLLHRAGDYYRSLRILRLYFADLLSLSTDAMPSSFWERIFPLPVVEFIKHQAPPGSADPYVVAAVMREESAYNTKAVSIAGAVGLMQLMPKTGQWVARQLGQEAFEPKQLFNPEINTRFGSWYLGHLARHFDGNLVLTIASYNAGPEVVSRWAQIRPPEPDALDEFIESIPFSETRAFTKRVLRSYTEYLRLAGLDPAQRFTRPILLSSR